MTLTLKSPGVLFLVEGPISCSVWSSPAGFGGDTTQVVMGAACGIASVCPIIGCLACLPASGSVRCSLHCNSAFTPPRPPGLAGGRCSDQRESWGRGGPGVGWGRRAPWQALEIHQALVPIIAQLCLGELGGCSLHASTLFLTIRILRTLGNENDLRKIIIRVCPKSLIELALLLNLNIILFKARLCLPYCKIIYSS